MILNVSGRRMITAYAVYAVLHFCTVGSLCLGTTAALADVSTPPSTTASSDPKLLDEVWRQVRDNFYDPKLHGLDWQAVGDEHRPDYAAATTDAERSAAINAMLGKLGASHTRHYSKDEPAYFQLLEIFSYPLRDGIKRMFGSSKPTYTGIGIFTKELDGRTFVSGVMAGLAGSKAGLLVGDEIVHVDDKRFEPIGSFRGKAGQPVRIEIRRHKEGPTRRIIVVPEVIEPGEAFNTSITQGARIIERNGRRIGHVPILSYADGDYQETLVDLLSAGKLKDADAVIWDLRDGWGGAHPRYLDVFVPQGADMTLTERSGKTERVNFRWRKPVALVINNGSRSGKEVLAHAFKEYNVGPVIGETTAGALLAGRAFLLSDDSLLILAVNDVKVNEVRVEGVGVSPTVNVPFDIRYAAGRDPQIDKAVALLSGAQDDG
jgi:carboxyl-terminal processing protease